VLCGFFRPLLVRLCDGGSSNDVSLLEFEFESDELTESRDIHFRFLDESFRLCLVSFVPPEVTYTTAFTGSTSAVVVGFTGARLGIATMLPDCVLLLE